MKLPYQLGLGSRGKPVYSSSSSSRQETAHSTFISTIIRAWTTAAGTERRRAPRLVANSGAPAGARFEPRSPSPQGEEEASPRIGQESPPPTSCLCDEAPETSGISSPSPTPSPSLSVSDLPSDDISSTISEGTPSSDPTDGTITTTSSSRVEDIETISSQVSSGEVTTSSQDGFRTVTVTYTLSNPPSATGGPRTTTSSSQTSLPTGDPDASGAFEQMALTGDAAAALISGFVILLLFLIILAIWLFSRRRNRESIGSPSSNELTDMAPPPTIHLDLPSAAVTPRPSVDVLGQPATIVPGTGNWPLPENQIRIPIRPRPKRRTLSSELSPFGYTAPISESGTESRPLSISAAWLRPLTGRRNRNGNGNGGSGTTTPSGLRTQTPNV